MTALHIAAENGHPELVEILLSHGTMVDAVDLQVCHMIFYYPPGTTFPAIMLVCPAIQHWMCSIPPWPATSFLYGT